MAIRILNTILLIVTVIGAVLAYRASQKHRELAGEFHRLDEKIGMPIGDPSKIHVRPLKTDSELGFAWRVYVPANLATDWQVLSCPDYSDTQLDRLHKPYDADFVARLSLRENPNGEVQGCFRAWNCEESLFSSRSDDLCELLHGRLHELCIEHGEPEGVIELDADEIVTLLRITLPDHLREKGRRLRWPVRRSELVIVRIGSSQAFEREAATKGGRSAR